jgi:hypothetical protein
MQVPIIFLIFFFEIILLKAITFKLLLEKWMKYVLHNEVQSLCNLQL